MKKRNISYYLSIISIIVSFLSVRIALYHNNAYNDYNYLGIIVSALAILVTFLVAWQIWNSLDVREKIDKIDALSKEIEPIGMEIYDFKNDINGSMYLIQGMIGFTNIENKEYLLQYANFQKSLLCFIKTNQSYTKENISLSILYMKQVLDKRENDNDKVDRLEQNSSFSYDIIELEGEEILNTNSDVFDKIAKRRYEQIYKRIVFILNELRSNTGL